MGDVFPFQGVRGGRKTAMKTEKGQRLQREETSSLDGDWFYDELMTAQPEATQAFYRERLSQNSRDPQAKAHPAADLAPAED